MVEISKDSKTVLIVEDDIFLSNLLTTRLKKDGVNVLKAGDGEEALDMLRKNKPDLMTLDIIIPKKSGFEVLEEMRADSMLKDTATIVVSNLGQEADIARAKNLGALSYFIKAQVSIDEIVARIKAYLEKGTV